MNAPWNNDAFLLSIQESKQTFTTARPITSMFYKRSQKTHPETKKDAFLHTRSLKVNQNPTSLVHGAERSFYLFSRTEI